MTGLDTNILVRFFLQDDAVKGNLATKVMSSLSVDETGWVGIPVLLDLVWEMTHNHKMKRVEVFQILDKLLSSREIVVEQSEIVRESLNLYRNTRADFADCLIAASAKAAGCSRTVTFDRIAARDAGMDLVG